MGSNKFNKKKIESAVKLKTGWMKVFKNSDKYNFKYLYEGELIKGRANGFGVLLRIYEDDNIFKEYIGNWVNGKKQGLGGLWFTDGGYYEGNFCQGRRHGFGRMWCHDGKFYQGTWLNGFYHGTGMLIQANGNRYEGEFIQGKKHGNGIFYHFITGQMQEGNWTNDICKNGIITDMNYRDNSPKPTIYLIPKLGKYISQDNYNNNLTNPD